MTVLLTACLEMSPAFDDIFIGDTGFYLVPRIGIELRLNGFAPDSAASKPARKVSSPADLLVAPSQGCTKGVL